MSEILEQEIESYETPYAPEHKTKHTFYFNELLFLQQLQYHHDTDNGQEPVIIVCNDCSQEFPISYGSYIELKDQMMHTYNKKISNDGS